MNRIYFDNNASTPLDPKIIEAIQEELEIPVANPSSPHYEGQQARGRLDRARRVVASFFGFKPNEVIFTSSGTEAMNLLVQSGVKGEVITSDSEHSCVYELLKSNPQARFIKGAVTLEAVKALYTPKTALIVLMAVNNETGIKTPIDEIASWAESQGLPFVVDGVAWLGKEKVVIPRGVSGIGFSGHKIHAPPGIGCALFRAPLKLKPLLIGGAQEFGLRGGTENRLGIVAFAKGLELLNYASIQPLRDRFEEQILRLPNTSINGLAFPRISNVSNVLFAGHDGETLLMKLDQAGLSASLGSACTSGALEPSRPLLSLGLSYTQAKSSLRFSFSRFNTMEEVERGLRIIEQVV